MSEPMDEFETQLMTLRPVSIGPNVFDRIESKITKNRHAHRLPRLVQLCAIAAAACVALAVIVAEKQRTSNAVREISDKYQKQLDDAHAALDIQWLQNKQDLRDQKSRVAELSKMLDIEKKSYDAVTEHLKPRGVPVQEPITTRVDGTILTTDKDNVVMINLGQSDHVAAGLTFEVYSKQGVVPRLGDGLSDTNLPIGEASIEVQKVQDKTSLCRVTRLEPGQHIVQGDLITNLVYERMAKFNFVVYGQFDLNQSGHPNLADADVIKSLVTQWGGKIQPDINVDTDFVVMGSEPRVETFTPVDLQEPFNMNQYNREIAAQKAYQDEIAKAKDLSIPIMNQNRFLYYCGYYDLATR